MNRLDHKLVLFCILSTNIAGLQAMSTAGSCAKKYCKYGAIVAAGTYNFQNYRQEIATAKQIIEDSPDLSDFSASKYRTILMEKAPQVASIIDRIEFKTTKYVPGPCVTQDLPGYEGRSFMFFSEHIESPESASWRELLLRHKLDLKRYESDTFILLHELGHLYNRDSFLRNKASLFFAGLDCGSLYYVLRSLSIGRVLKGAALILAGRIAAFNWSRIRENAADEFAIDCLKRQRDLGALRAGARFIDTEAKLYADDEKHLKPGQKLFNLITATHPQSFARAKKIESAITELEAQESREIKE